MANVLIFIDNPGDSLKKSSLELLTVGRALGDTAVALNGSLSDAVMASFAEYGVGTVYRPAAAGPGRLPRCGQSGLPVGRGGGRRRGHRAP